MQRRHAWIFGLALAAGCARQNPSQEDAGAAGRAVPTPTVTVSATSSAAPSTKAGGRPGASASSKPNAPSAEDRDFDDAFAYGGIDAGAGDPKRIAHANGYTRYVNERFGFSLDVPKGLDAMPGPTNGDGMQWRNGNLVVLTASGMNNVLDSKPECARSKNVTAHKETATTCWATGKRDGYVFWERSAIANDVIYSIRFQYAESLKTAMDPVVARVNDSWKY